MADSQALIDAMVDLGARRESVLLMSWGVDLEHFRPTDGGREDARAALGLPEGRVILSPRSLMPLYNPRTIVDAFELLADELPDVQLVLKHMGTDRPPVGPLRYPDRVHIVGHVPYARMVDWYRASDVCVSIASSDSSPRSVWEAVASGTPCVVSDLPWVHELIEPGRDALVVPIAPEPVAAAIRADPRRPLPSPSAWPATAGGWSRRTITRRWRWTASPTATGGSPHAGLVGVAVATLSPCVGGHGSCRRSWRCCWRA